MPKVGKKKFPYTKKGKKAARKAAKKTGKKVSRGYQQMKQSRIDAWREAVESRLEEISIVNAKQSGELSHIKESVDEIKSMVKEQNGRVRTLEKQTSALQSAGSVITVIIGGLIGWLFNTRS